MYEDSNFYSYFYSSLSGELIKTGESGVGMSMAMIDNKDLISNITEKSQNQIRYWGLSLSGFQWYFLC